MDPKEQSSPPEITDAQAAFRKPSNDTTTRKYRRRSPDSGSSSPSGSPIRERSSSPGVSKEDSVRVYSHQNKRRDYRRESERDSSRSQYGRSHDVYRHSNQYYSRHFYGHHRHDDHRRDKYADEDTGDYRSSYRSARNSRDTTQADGMRVENKQYRSKDHKRHADNYTRDRYESSGNRRRDKEKGTLSLEDTKYSEGGFPSDHTCSNEAQKAHRNDSSLRREHLKERHRSETRDLDGQRKHKDRYYRGAGEHTTDKTVFVSGNQNSPAKQSFLNLDEGSGHSQSAQDVSGKVAFKQDRANSSDATNDLNAAKVAAMRAAEIVNKNLVGLGHMSTDQKKKLLWGKKNDTVTEESASKWDATLFPDRERQEKFKKLMSLRLPWCLWPIVGCEGRSESGAQIRRPGWKQSLTGGEGEGAPTGLGEAVYRRPPTQRWSHCWAWSLRVCSFLLYCIFITISSFRYCLHCLLQSHSSFRVLVEEV